MRSFPLVLAFAFAACAGSLGAAALAPHSAYASTAIALSLQDLVDRSESVVVAIPRSKVSRWESGRIVTYTTVAIDTAVAGGGKAGDTMTVRTLGGVVDDIGQIAHGEAVLPIDKPIVLFLRAMPAAPKVPAGSAISSMAVIGMSQGAMPVEIGADKIARVIARSADLVLVPNAKVDPKLQKPAAAIALGGKALPTAIADIRSAWAARAKK